MNIYMKRTLLLMRSSVTTFYANKPNHFPSSLVASTQSPLRLYSSNGNGSNLTHTQKPNSSLDTEDISNPELKKLIDKFYEGDAEAIPSIFEAILKRKLAGKYEEADKELMEEIVGKTHESSDDIEDEESNEEFESDLDELSETDEYIDELHNAREIAMKRMARDE
ncbi:hypothetical protein CMV_000083 [Castanea mollissima]|uniref:Uncharacterized protein n=1 Tax=Castanea mollissima TaxID=60419 RepID=A0A8J4W7N3_9ROSI|nr:hypothetical protein CMV_000083 [Castanea mollissima]